MITRSLLTQRSISQIFVAIALLSVGLNSQMLIAHAASPADAARQAIDRAKSGCLDYRKDGETTYRFSYRHEGNESSTHYLLVSMPCNLAAYNSAERWFLIDEDGETTPLAFAMPKLKVTYKDPDGYTKLSSIKITGYSASVLISNSGFDEKTLTISGGHKWRGLADAYDFARWRFIDGEFILTHFEVDPTYDGKDTPKILIGH